ncbi:MAG: transposase [Pirellulales bacterium]|nr:transposase [Pirellulales bacterium]
MVLNQSKKGSSPITRPLQSTAIDEVVQLLAEHGFDGLADAVTVVLNEAMKIERTRALGAQPYERTPARRGQANGFKPKTVLSRLGKLELKVPQTRDSSFYPSALERGERSERALKVALAEMYVQGVSTRKVKAIVEELCGSEVSSTQVSRCAAELDEELTKGTKRGQVHFLHSIFHFLSPCGAGECSKSCRRLSAVLIWTSPLIPPAATSPLRQRRTAPRLGGRSVQGTQFIL